MREKFRESDKAASYVSSGLLSQFPSATAEVIHVTRNRPRRVTCEIREIGPVLQRMCRHFPMTAVEYHPDNAYGFVAEIECHGERAKGPFRARKPNRERIVILLTRIDGKDVIVGSTPAQASLDPSPDD